MVPGDDFGGVDADYGAFGGLLAALVVVHGEVAAGLAGVAGFAAGGVLDGDDQVGVVLDDVGLAFDDEAFELLVLGAGFEHDGDFGVALEVLDLLGFGVGGEVDLAVDDAVPHGDQVGVAAGADGGGLEGPAVVDVGLDLFVGHVDLAASAGHVALLGLRLRRRGF